jgi:hypothetical protein
MARSGSFILYVPKYVIVPCTVAWFSSAVPFMRSLTTNAGRLARMTVMMKFPFRSKKAIPVGLSPNVCSLLPSGRT